MTWAIGQSNFLYSLFFILLEALHGGMVCGSWGACERGHETYMHIADSHGHGHAVAWVYKVGIIHDINGTMGCVVGNHSRSLT